MTPITLSKSQTSCIESLDELLAYGIRPYAQDIKTKQRQEETVDGMRLVDPEKVHLSDTLSRRIYNQPEMLSLVDSIRVNGVIEPVIVRPLVVPLEREPSGEWECIAGSRRVLAAREAGVQIPIIVRNANNIEARGISLVTTLQRADITAYEKAQALVALQKDMQKELDYWVQESIDAGLVHPTSAKNNSNKNPVKIVTAMAWEEIRREFIEMPSWVTRAFHRSVDRRTPVITIEDVAIQVGLSKETVNKYFSVAKLGDTLEEDKLEKITLPELRMVTSIKTPSLKKKLVNALSKGLTGKQAQVKLQKIKLKDQEISARSEFGESQQTKDAIELNSIKPYIVEVTRSMEKLSGKLKMSTLNERKDYPALEKELLSGIARWDQVIGSIKGRQIGDSDLINQQRYGT